VGASTGKSMARLDRRLLFAIDDLVAAFRFALDRNPRRKNVNELTRNCESYRYFLTLKLDLT
jgi:hypothetical protein